MFTGIIEEIGIIKTISKGKHSSVLTISAQKVLADTQIGDSIAVDGVCLTARSLTDTTFTADVMSETLSLSTLSDFKQNSPVNLERALLANGRFGGHIVYGHIDGVGIITDLSPDDNAVIITIKPSLDVLNYIIHKGSIAIDGISLTVTNVDNNSFAVSVIPHTVVKTTILKKTVGCKVNLECDVVGKYIKNFLSAPDPLKKSNIDIDFLNKCGFGVF